MEFENEVFLDPRPLLFNARGRVVRDFEDHRTTGFSRLYRVTDELRKLYELREEEYERVLDAIKNGEDPVKLLGAAPSPLTQRIRQERTKSVLGFVQFRIVHFGTVFNEDDPALYIDFLEGDDALIVSALFDDIGEDRYSNEYPPVFNGSPYGDIICIDEAYSGTEPGWEAKAVAAFLSEFPDADRAVALSSSSRSREWLQTLGFFQLTDEVWAVDRALKGAP